MPGRKFEAVTPKAAAAALKSGAAILADGKSLKLVVRRGYGFWIVGYRDPSVPSGFSSQCIGKYPELSPAAARREREAFMHNRRHAAPAPVTEILQAITMPQRPTEVKGATFGAAVRAYIEEKSQAWKGGARGATARQWKTSLVTHGGDLAPLALNEITPDRVQLFLEPLSQVQKMRVRAQIDLVLEYMRTGIVKKARPPVQHFAAMNYADVPQFMATLAKEGAPAAKILAFTILTGARIGEVVGDKYGKPALTWKEITNGNGYVWTVPASRMKKNKEHRVPLSAAALALLGPRGADDDKVFAVGMTTTDKLRRRLAPTVTIHGFRASFRTWCQDQSVDNMLAEAALSHYPGGASYHSYARGDMFDRRRELMDKWAAFCGSAS